MSNGSVGAAPGHGNFPANKFSPVLFSKSLVYFNRTTSISMDITNTDYEGLIAEYGSRVEILKEPEIGVNPYYRGQELPIQFMDDDYIQMDIDQAYQFNFLVDDIEKRQSHIDWMVTGKDSGLYKLRDAMDSDVLQYMHDNATDAPSLGTSGSPVTVGFANGQEISPLDVLGKLALALDENSVPRDSGRWFVGPPSFYEALEREDSSLINASVMGDPISVLRDSKFGLDRTLRGFKCYVTNNNPTSSNADITVMAGHTNATSTATNVVKTETVRDGRYFGTFCRGLLVWGRKVIKPENIVTGYIQYS